MELHWRHLKPSATQSRSFLASSLQSLLSIPNRLCFKFSQYTITFNYKWAQGSTFFSFMHHVYIDIIKKYSWGETCTRLRSYFISENFKKSVVWNLHWKSHSPRKLNPPNLTDLEYESRNKLTTTSRDGLHGITKELLYSFCPNVKTQGWFRRVFKDDLPFTQWLALFGYINLRKKGVPDPFHGCLWTIEYIVSTHFPLYMRNFLFTRWSNFSLQNPPSLLIW